MLSPNVISPPPELKLCELRTVAELETIAGEWLALWNQSGATPFQSPMWLIPWARQFTAGNLCVIAAYESERLIGIAPFFEWHNPTSARLELRLLGDGLSDYLDICTTEKDADRFHEVLEHWICKSKYEYCEFDQLDPKSPLLNLDPEKFQRRESEGSPCPILSGKTITNYGSPQKLEQLGYYRRRAKKIGVIEIENAAVENGLEVLEELFALHQAQWNARGQTGVLHDEKTRQFHREAVHRLSVTRVLRLCRMRLNRRTMGVLYAFTNASTSYYYLSGFNPEFNKLSPGTLMVGHAIEQAISENRMDFNFLRGQGPYKYAWGAQDNSTIRLQLSR